MKNNYTTEELYTIALSRVKGIGYSLAQKLISHFGNAQQIYHASIKELTQVDGISKNIAEEIFTKKTLDEAKSLIDKHTKIGISLLTPWDSLYPFRLKHIHNAPILLFCKGIDFINHQKIVAIVGTRNSTNYGKKITQNLIEDLLIYTPVILSGLAYGIDIIAHKTAIDLGLPTIAVYAGGIDMVYPKDHSQIANKIITYGGLVTEYPMGTEVEVYQFPARNRIVAGMADAVIVVEAPEKSGALITAIYANDYNREVFAVPGNLNDKNSIGCHNLIKNHQAHMITCANDLITLMNWDEESKKKSKPQQLSIDLIPNLSEDEISILKIITQNNIGIHIDDLAEATKFSTGKLSTLLLKMEMAEHIVCLPGKKYKTA